MLRRMLVTIVLLGGLLGCAKPGVFGSSNEYNHGSNDAADRPYQAAFPAPNGGYLFPFHDLVLEVVLERKGAAVVFFYDAEGNPVPVETFGRKAGLTIETPGRSSSFTVGLYRYGENAYAGRFPITETPAIARSMALRFKLALDNTRDNYVQEQCHSGHWGVAAGGKFYGEPVSASSAP